MTVVEVNGVHPKSLETLFTCSPDILGVRVEGVFSIRLALKAEFGGKNNIIALARPLHPFANDILAVTVDVGHVPKTQPSGICMVQKSYSLIESPRWSVESAHAPESKSNGRDLGPISA
jgi:hypothetical protein